MSTARTALLATAIVFLIAAFHTFYLGFLDSPLRYESLPWISEGAGRLFGGSAQDGGGNEFLIGVGKADITGYVHILSLYIFQRVREDAEC